MYGSGKDQESVRRSISLLGNDRNADNVEIKHTVKQRIETVGRNGGLLLAPTHKIQPDVPWENILAFFDALDEFGNYSIGMA